MNGKGSGAGALLAVVVLAATARAEVVSFDALRASLLREAAVLAYARGDLAAAKSCFEKVLRIRDADPSDHAAAALGLVHARVEPCPGEEAAWLLDLALGQPSIEPMTRIGALLERAGLHAGAGRVAESGRDREEAVAQVLRVRPPRSPMVLMDAAKLAVAAGEADRGVELVGLSVDAARGGPELVTRLTIGLDLLVHLERYRELLPFRKELLEIRAAREGDALHPTTLRVLAQASAVLGEHELALLLWSEALGGTPPDSPAAAEITHDIAITLQFLKRHAEARERFAEAAATFRRLDDRAGRALVLVNSAVLELELGEAGRAGKRFKRAYALALRQGNRRIEACARAGLAATYRELGRPAKARATALAALRPRDGALPLDSRLWLHETLARLAAAAADPDEMGKWIAATERLLEEDDVARMPPRERASFRSRFHEWARITQDWISLRLRAADPERRAGVLEEGLAAAERWKARSLLEEIAARQGPLDLDDSVGDRRWLGSDTLLVAYADGSERTYGYVADREGLARHELGERAVIAEKVAAYRRMLVSHETRPAALVAAGAELHALLLGPCLAARPAARLVVVPTPDLLGLPFQALATTDTGDGWSFATVRYVADERVVVHAPSVAIAAALSRFAMDVRDGPALIVGDPTPALPGFGELAHARREAIDLFARILDVRGLPLPPELTELSYRKLHTFTWAGLRLFLGPEATVSALEELEVRDGLVLFACHGNLDPSDPARNGLVLAPDPARGDDGLLDLATIARLGFRADLVVLPACSSAAGRVLPGEGVQSVAHAFLQGGARGAVGALWPVDDAPAADFMAAFYERLLDGEHPADALTAATQAARVARPRGASADDPRVDRTGHPATWAAFTYIGGPPGASASDSTGR